MYANFKRQLEIHNRKRIEEHGCSEFTMHLLGWKVNSG